MIQLEIAYAPIGTYPWGDYFRDRLAEAGVPSRDGTSFGDVQTVILTVREDEIPRMVEVVYEAIDYANDQFEEHDLAAAREAIQRVAAREQAAAERRTHLNGLVEP